jgi:hypothetical protein
VLLLEALIGKGRKVRVYDPHIHLGEIYGTNQRYIMNATPHIGNLLDDHREGMLDWSEQVLLPQKPSAAIQARLGSHPQASHRFGRSAPPEMKPARRIVSVFGVDPQRIGGGEVVARALSQRLAARNWQSVLVY